MAEETVRSARCSCGALTVETRGEPQIVAMCSCSECQRRTGSAFGLSAYWPIENVVLSGESRVWSRVSERGRRFEQHFCPTCGGALWWRADFLEDKIGVAAGCFADPTFPSPDIAVWDVHRHRWLDRLSELPTHPEQRF